MADIRIKDLATTASVTASDDFMAVDGAINGTRKLSAATPSFLTSVTTPSLTSPASTPLTLGLGTGGTALTLASSTLAATFAGALTVTGDASIGTNVFKIDTTNTRILLGLAGALQGDTLEIASKSDGGTVSFFGRAADNGSTLAFRANGAGTLKGFINGSDSGVNIAAGSTTRIGIAASTGDVSISSTTASSSAITGALQVAGGIGAGGASYFGGAVTATGGSGTIFSGADTVTNLSIIAFGDTSRNGASIYSNNSFLAINSKTGVNHIYLQDINSNPSATVNIFSGNVVFSQTGAATFAGAVAIGNTTAASVAAPSTHKVSILIGGVQYYLLASNV